MKLLKAIGIGIIISIVNLLCIIFIISIVNIITEIDKLFNIDYNYWIFVFLIVSIVSTIVAYKQLNK